MEDDIDDKIIYQTYVSHMKIMSKLAWSVPLKVSHIPLSYSWRMLKIYLLKPEFIIFGALIIFVLMYMQAVDQWSRNLLGRLQYTINRPKSKVDKLNFFSGDAEASWEMKVGPIAAYAIQGRRPKMEDRFVIHDNINNTGVALFAVFDGHGGEFAANFAKEKLVPNLLNKVIQIKDLCSSSKDSKGAIPKDYEDDDDDKKVEDKPITPSLSERRKSFKRTSSTADECVSGVKEITDKELLNKLDSIKPISRDSRPLKVSSSFKKTPVTSYFDKYGNVNYGKLLTDEVLAADERLLEVAKKTLDVAGTTALIAILEGSKLIVANVGDSRGVMCDGKGNVIPLSFDHKPQQMRERKRIKEAGGFVTFNGVWRVAGILATSRALGDYPLKDKKLVIADPDILSFDMNDHKPSFIILASDGLWDTFSNEEAINFIKERLHEPDYGAKSITLQSFYRGSTDNITVIIINFKDKKHGFYKSE